MATVNFQIETQETMNALSGTAAVVQGPLSVAFDAQLRAMQLSSQLFATPISWRLEGQEVILNFANEASVVYSGVVLSDPNASHGTGTATGYALRVPFSAWYDNQGVYNFTYDVVNGVLVVKMQSVIKTFESLQFVDAPPGSKSPFGDVTGTVSGNWQTDSNGNVSGTLHELQFAGYGSYGYLQVDGNFAVSGNTASVTSGASHSNVSGTLSDYSIPFVDGSVVKVTDANAQLGANDALDWRFLSNPSHFSGDDTINVILYANLQLVNDQVLAAGDGNDVITTVGGGDKLRIDAGAGNDTIKLYQGAHAVDGGTGTDTVYLSAFYNDLKISHNADGFTVTEPLYGNHVLKNVERLEVLDHGIAFDLDGNAGQAYRIYQAAFNRQPDVEGLGYWMGVMDQGASLHSVAANFIDSKEFQTLYGSAPSDTVFLDLLYRNVLHRTPDQAGYDYWLDVMHKGADRAGVLANFSESTENKAQVIGAIQDGITYSGSWVHGMF